MTAHAPPAPPSAEECRPIEAGALALLRSNRRRARHPRDGRPHMLAGDGATWTQQAQSVERAIGERLRCDVGFYRGRDARRGRLLRVRSVAGLHAKPGQSARRSSRAGKPAVPGTLVLVEVSRLPGRTRTPRVL